MICSIFYNVLRIRMPSMWIQIFTFCGYGSGYLERDLLNLKKSYNTFLTVYETDKKKFSDTTAFDFCNMIFRWCPQTMKHSITKYVRKLPPPPAFHQYTRKLPPPLLFISICVKIPPSLTFHQNKRKFPLPYFHQYTRKFPPYFSSVYT